MARKVFYEIEKKRFQVIEVETEEQAQLVKELNRDLERADKQEKRSQARYASLEELAEENGIEAVSSDMPIDEQLEQKEEAAALHKAMESLTDKQREVIRLRFWEGLTLEEIAKQKQIKVSSVGECLAAAEKKLKKFLQNTLKN